MCKCSSDNTVYFWSFEKEVFLPSTASLPKGFGLFTGCPVAISKSKILLIGGHWLKSDLENYAQYAHYAQYDYLIRYPPNNQVVEYDLEKRKWNFLQDVTLPYVGNIHELYLD